MNLYQRLYIIDTEMKYQLVSIFLFVFIACANAAFINGKVLHYLSVLQSNNEKLCPERYVDIQNNKTVRYVASLFDYGLSDFGLYSFKDCHEFARFINSFFMMKYNGLMHLSYCFYQEMSKQHLVDAVGFCCENDKKCTTLQNHLGFDEHLQLHSDTFLKAYEEYLIERLYTNKTCVLNYQISDYFSTITKNKEEQE